MVQPSILRLGRDTMNDPTILLVEDAPTDVLLTQRALKKSLIKARLIIAADGEAALQMLEGKGDISLILLDLHLPKVDGLHILEQIRGDEHTRSTPVVVVTSSELTYERTRAMEGGADAYISKPIDPVKLRQIVEDLNIESLLPGG